MFIDVPIILQDPDDILRIRDPMLYGQIMEGIPAYFGACREPIQDIQGQFILLIVVKGRFQS
jgi:hypothetical protein